MMQFDLPKDLSSIIKVIGVGGGGSNAVNHMFRQGIKGVDFIVCNTDKQALDISPVPVKVQLGKTLTQGLGAGMLPEVGKNAAIESIDEIKALLKNTKMVFITAGMGKGTGTGAAPIIAQAAREMGILTVGIVTIPFSFEGAKKRQQAEAGIEELKKSVDTLLIICNERLREIHGNLTVVNAFVHADNVLSNAARSIAEIISNTLHVNVDFNDISTVMKDSGVAVLGTASASGDGRAINAVEMALNSPLLNDNEITGARYVLMNVTSGADEITMDELGEITDYIQNAAGQTAEIVTGYGVDPNLGDKVNVTIIATGFQSKSIAGVQSTKRPEKKVLKLDDNVNKTAEPTPVVEAKTKVEETIESLEPVLKSELLAKEEPVIETFKEEVTLNDIVTDPLEPVLIVKEPVVENAIEIEDTNDSEETVIVDEPLLEVKVEEIVPVVEEPVVEMKREEPVLVETGEAVAEVKVEEPIAEVKTEEPVAEVKVEETIADLSPVTDVKEEVKTGEPVAVVETVTEISNVIPVVEETKQEIVEEKVEIEFEIEKAPEKVVEFTLTEEVVENTVTEPVKEETLLPVNEVKTEAPVVNEVKEEISNMVVNEVKEEVKQEPVAEVKEEVKSEVEQKKEEVLEEPILIKNRTEVKEEKKSTELPTTQLVTDEEQRKKAQERILRLKELSLKLKSPNGLAELENEPAYKRKNINLQSTPHSSESQVSKYTLTENEEKKVEIKPNNSFLHDNVD
ncbi:MAG TPA: cell division protein FtsZ [Bacteroidia bacterium]|jgi:cell division protein FtsZ